MKIAIIGGTGLLGSNLVKLYSAKNFEVKSFSRKKSDNLDFIKNVIINFEHLENELIRYFSSWTPDIIINTVALVNLQKCEEDYEIAYYINCGIATKIAKVSNVYNSYYVHISTDHYFDDGIKYHTEDDKVNLLNNYAKTKYYAEQEIIKYTDNYLLIRTNIIGFRNTTESFFEWLINSLEENKEIDLYTNFYTSPIYVNDLGNILINCYEKELIGVYNVASKEMTSKYNFGMKTAKKFNFKIDKIKKSKIENCISSLSRALTLGLDVSKIENALNIQMPTIDETLNNLYIEYEGKK